jgi:hypothetical protein
MSYYFNKVKDLIKSKIYVDQGPLEQSKEDKKEDTTESDNTPKTTKITSMTQYLLNEGNNSKPEIIDNSNFQLEQNNGNGVVVSNNISQNAIQSNSTQIAAKDNISIEDMRKEMLKDFEVCNMI